MKEPTFIELLNLYIDQQITPDDAARLEEEIQTNPRRRRVYQQYCRMHRACTIVMENYGAAAETGDEVEFQTPARRAVWGYYVAGLAAACVAMVTAQLYWRPAANAGAGQPAAVPLAAAPANSQSVVAVPVRMNLAATEIGRARMGSGLDQRLLLQLPAYGQNASARVMVDSPSARVPLRPLSVVETTPAVSRSTIEQFVFQTDATSLDSGPVFRVRRSTNNSQEEMTAYQFQR